MFLLNYNLLCYNYTGEFMIKKINKYIIIFCFFISFFSLLITSKNSFLYCFNDWVDANAFFTVGKSMFNNIIPYKDLFEQKGPLLYLIYGLGYLVSNKSFHGVFIIEVISFTIFLYFAHKIFKLYFNERYSILFLPLLSFFVTTCPFFVHGGSCEEFCLPFICGSLYYFIRHFKDKKLSNLEMFINGLFAGIVLLMKYTMLGFWIGFGLFIVFDYFKKKEYKKIFMFCFFFLLGMFVPFIICSIYFIFNDAFKEFIDVYFILNMTAYTEVEKTNIFIRLFEIIKYSIVELFNTKLLMLLILLFFVSNLIDKKNNNLLFSLFGLIFTTVFFSFFGLKSYNYYNLPIYFLLIIFNMIFICLYFNKYIKRFFITKYIVLFFILFLSFVYIFSNNKDYIFMNKDDFVQYKYAKYINKYENPTLLNMGFLDIGVYTLAGITPNTRFFEVQNFSYDKFRDNIDEMNSYVKNKKVKFIVYSNEYELDVPEYLFDYYETVYVDSYYYESRYYVSYLFKLKEL